jgi:hypothetical protein
MDTNCATIKMVAACFSFLGGCESQDVAKQAVIILAKSSALSNDKSGKDKLAEMSSDEIFETYYEGVCAEAGYKSG